jgi:hypothetical protein
MGRAGGAQDEHRAGGAQDKHRAGGAQDKHRAGGAQDKHSSGARTVTVVILLTAAIVAWAALPMTGVSVRAWVAFYAAAAFAVLSVLRLLDAGIGTGLATNSSPAGGTLKGSLYTPVPERAWRAARSTLATVPSPQLMIVAVLALEGLHPRRPWHTAIFGLVLLGYLIALHLAESAARLAVFRPQLPLIAAGICLAGISVAAATLPAGGAGAGSGWLAVLAAAAAIVAAALALTV